MKYLPECCFGHFLLHISSYWEVLYANQNYEKWVSRSSEGKYMEQAEGQEPQLHKE